MNEPSREAPSTIVAQGAEELARHIYGNDPFEHTYATPPHLSPQAFDLRPLQTPHSIIKGVLSSLYTLSANDSEFFAYARSFLSVAHLYGGGNMDKGYDLTLDARRSEIRVFRRDVPESYLIIDYDRPLTRPRESWNAFFMGLAYRTAERSSCASGRRVGAVFVRNKSMLVAAYNGVPSGYPHPEVCPRIAAGCKSGEGLNMCPCNHAETNGIALAARQGVSLDDAILYCTTRPCESCSGLLANLGLRYVVFDNDYPHPMAAAITEHAKLPSYQFLEAPDL